MSKKPKKSFNLFGLILVIIGVMYMFDVCSDGKKNTKNIKTTKKSEKNQPLEWQNIKKKEIKIIANENAEPNLTRNFYFIIDGSGSMSERTGKNCGNSGAFSNKLEGAKWAVKTFLKNVPDDINIGLYVFDYNGKKEVVSLAKNNRKIFLNKVDEIKPGGGTPLAAAIRYGTDRLIDEYKNQLGYGEFRLVVVTDGIASKIYEAAKYAATYGISLYSIGLCVDESHPLRKYSVSYKAADNFEALSEGLSETLAELPDFNVSEFEQNNEDNTEKN